MKPGIFLITLSLLVSSSLAVRGQAGGATLCELVKSQGFANDCNAHFYKLKTEYFNPHMLTSSVRTTSAMAFDDNPETYALSHPGKDMKMDLTFVDFRIAHIVGIELLFAAEEDNPMNLIEIYSSLSGDVASEAIEWKLYKTLEIFEDPVNKTPNPLVVFMGIGAEELKARRFRIVNKGTGQLAIAELRLFVSQLEDDRPRPKSAHALSVHTLSVTTTICKQDDFGDLDVGGNVEVELYDKDGEGSRFETRPRKHNLWNTGGKNFVHIADNQTVVGDGIAYYVWNTSGENARLRFRIYLSNHDVLDKWDAFTLSDGLQYIDVPLYQFIETATGETRTLSWKSTDRFGNEITVSCLYEYTR